MKRSRGHAAARRQGAPTHFLFFTYRTPTEVKPVEERGRRKRASDVVRKAGGTCEIFRISWSGFDMVSIVRKLSTVQVMKLAAEINSWGSVHTTVVATSQVDIRKG
jgi:uncharacterized protein with GYD domain